MKQEMRYFALSPLTGMIREPVGNGREDLDKPTDHLRDSLGDLGAWMEETEHHRQSKAQPLGRLRAQVA